MSGNGTRATHRDKPRMRLHPLYAAVVAMMPAFAGAEIVPDQNAAQRASMNQTANGTPLVNIVDPNQRGISHNKFQSLDVDAAGVVFNNSMRDGASAIGGMAMKNPNLSSQARAVIGEVTGSGGTALHGAMEIFGGRADLIIANPNGIQVNGASTVNANSLTLSTGRVLGQPDGSIRIGVERGAVNIDGNGISTEGLSHFDIVSRTARINGEINGEAAIKVVAGQGEYDHETRTHIAGQGAVADQPFAIDGSQLGSMYGGRIELVATDGGAGVRHQGVLLGNDSISVTANGDIVLGTAQSLHGSIGIDGRSVTVNGTARSGAAGLTSKREIAIKAMKAVGVNADLSSKEGVISIDASTLVQTAASIFAHRGEVADVAVPSIRINVDDYTIEGALHAIGSGGNRIEQASVVLRDGRFIVVDEAGSVIEGASVASLARIGAKAGALKIDANSIRNKGGAMIAEDGALQVNVAEIFSSDGMVSAAGNAKIGAGSLDNSGSIIGSDVTLDADSLANTGAIAGRKALGLQIGKRIDNAGRMQTDGTLMIDGLSELVNHDSGRIHGEVIRVDNARTIRNKGVIQAAASLALDGSDSLLNDGGTLAAGNSLGLRNVKSIDNLGGIILTNGTLSIDAAERIANRNAARIKAGTALSMANVGAISNNGSSIVTDGDLEITGAETIDNEEQGIIVAGPVNEQGRRIHKGEASLTVKAGRLNNSGGSAVRAKTGATLLVSSIINSGADSEISAGKDMVIDAGELTNDDSAKLVGEDSVTAKAELIRNQRKSLLRSDGRVVLDGSTSIENDRSSIEGDDVEIRSAQFINSGDVTGTGDVSVDVDKLANAKGAIWADSTLRLKVNDDLVFGGEAGALTSGLELDARTTGNIVVNDTLENNGSIKLKAARHLTNNAAIISAKGVALSADRIRNSENSLIWGMEDVSLKANTSIRNARNGNILSQGTMSMVAGTIVNEAGSIRSEGDMAIDARDLRNLTSYTGGEMSFGPEATVEHGARFATGLLTRTWLRLVITLPTLTSDFVVDKTAEIASGGTLRINQRGLHNPNAMVDGVARFDSVLNEGGIISATNNIHVKGDVVNQPRHLALDLYAFLSEERKEKIMIDDSNAPPFFFRSLYHFIDYLWGGVKVWKNNYWGDINFVYDERRDKGNPFSLIRSMDGATLNTVMATLFGPTWRAMTNEDLSRRWTQLKANDNAELRDMKFYMLPQEKGVISAGENVVHNAGSFTNGIGGVRVENRKIDVKVGSKDVSIVTPPYDVSVNLKKFEEFEMGISMLPAVKDLTSIHGMFERSSAWGKAAGGATSSTGDLTRSPPKVVPLYETRMKFIDQSKFFGSDYFFEQVGYNSTVPVNVIGDNYFINELIRRQLNDAVGAFFAVRDGVRDAGLVRMLMTNAGSVDGMGLEVGKPPTKEQLASLEKDIVWFVSEAVDGESVLVPRVYLATSTLTAMRSGEGDGSAIVHAGGSIRIDAESVKNASGSLMAGRDVTIRSKGDVENVSAGMNGGISAGGDVDIISTQGNVINNGAFIEAKDDVTLLAENGRVDITASAGYDAAGNLKLHEFDDSIKAGNDVNVFGKDVTLNSADISAGNDANLVATGGDLQSNEMHEAGSSYHYERTDGVLNYSSYESSAASARGDGSKVHAGNKLSMVAKNDISLEGGQYSGESGGMQAGGKLDVKTTTDHDFSTEKIVVSQFGFNAGVKGFGFEASANGGTQQGTATYAGVSDRQNPVEEGRSNSSNARKPGRATLDDMATVKAGYSRVEETSASQSSKHRNAEMAFGDGGLSMEAKTIDLGGANVRTAGLLDVSADDIETTKYLDESSSTRSRKSFSIGATAEAHSAVADAVNKYGELGNKAAKGGNDTDAGMTTLQVLGDMSNVLFNDLAGASAGVGIKSAKVNSTTSTWSENVNTIEAGKVSMRAKNDIELNGVQIKADEADLSAGGNVTMNAAKDGGKQETSANSFKLGTSVGASISIFGSGVGVSVDVGGTKDNSTTTWTNHANTTLDAAKVNISSGGDTTLAGANVQGTDVSVSTGGKLNVESVQDTLDHDRTKVNWGVSVGAAAAVNAAGVPVLIPTFSVDAGGGSEQRTERTTGSQSGIDAKGILNVNTTGDLNLKGGHLISESGQGAVDVGGSLHAESVDDSISQDGGYGGGGFGLSRAGVASVNAWGETVDKIDKQTRQSATISGVSLNASGVSGDVNTDATKTSEVVVDKTTSGNQISFTLGVSDIVGAAGRKKGSYDLRQRDDAGTRGTYTPIVDSPVAGRRSGPADGAQPSRQGGADARDGGPRTRDVGTVTDFDDAPDRRSSPVDADLLRSRVIGSKVEVEVENRLKSPEMAVPATRVTPVTPATPVATTQKPVPATPHVADADAAGENGKPKGPWEVKLLPRVTMSPGSATGKEAFNGARVMNTNIGKSMQALTPKGENPTAEVPTR